MYIPKAKEPVEKSQPKKRQIAENGTSVIILELEDGKYYVGKTSDVQRRIRQFETGHGSKWSKVHPFVKVLDIIANSSDVAKYTIEMMIKHGIENVRGGGFSRVILLPNDIHIIKHRIKMSKKPCHFCQSETHSASVCEKRHTMECHRCGRTSHEMDTCFARIGNRKQDNDHATKNKKQVPN